MDVTGLVDTVRASLTASASLGDERVREVAAALSAAVEPAVRLALLSAVSATADEVTAALLDVPGTPVVTARLDDDHVHVEVRASAHASGTLAADLTHAPPVEADGDGNARVSLRLSESLKAAVDSAARAAGVSSNTWLVRAAAAALPRGQQTERVSSPSRVRGWLNG